MIKTSQKTGEIVIYKAKDGQTKLKVKLQDETVWLNAKQMADLFKIDRTGIVKHIRNIYKSGELKPNSTCAIFAQVAKDNKIRQIDYYNLDIIISVGYRVNSIRGTQFRIWATKILKDYLIKGYALNQTRLLEQSEKFKELQRAISFIKDKSSFDLLKDQTSELIKIINDYTKSLTLLYQYDEGKIKFKRTKKPSFKLSIENSQNFIKELKEKLISKKEASSLFGHQIDKKFESIIGTIYQTFDKKELYETLEEKAANLLYLIIKDHPFSDGNKRTGSLLFIYFLEKNNYLWKENNERKISNETLVVLALLIATSDPKEKDIMVKIVTNLLV